MNRVAIIGTGLIGCSFGLALRQHGFSGEIVGVSSADALEAAKAAGAIDESASLSEAAQSADLLYLAQPVDRILATISQLNGLVKPGALVTDAGSTKAAIVEQAKRSLPGVEFIGGHPMAGKEQRGAQAADGKLFCGKPYIVTCATESRNGRLFLEWLKKIGARVVEMSPEEHDSTVALTSHLPQLLSTALAAMLAEHPNARVTEIFGTGLLDMTRLAMSSPELWSSILETNKPAVLKAVTVYAKTLEHLREQLERGSVVELFEVGANWAKTIREQSTN